MNFNNLNGLQLAKAFDISERTLYRWKKTDIPQNPDGSFNLAEVIKWRIKLHVDVVKPPGLMDAEIKAAWLLERQEKAQISRIRRQEMEQELIPADEVKREADFAGRLVKQKVSSWPGRVSALVAAEGDPFKCEQILIYETRALLEEISGSLP